MLFVRTRRALSGIAALFAVTWTAVGSTQPAQPGALRDFGKELSNKLTGRFVVAVAGAMSLREPIGAQIGEGLRVTLRDADTAVGQLEGYDGDRRNVFGDAGARDSAEQIAALGFDLLAMDGLQGAESTSRAAFTAFSDARVALARQDRQAAFQHLTQGRVALVQGPSPIRLSTAKYVTPQQLEQLKAIRDSIVARRHEPDVSRPIALPQDPPNQVTIFADTFVAGPIAGEIRHEVAAAERQANVLSVRNVKEFADFAVFAMPLPPSTGGEHHQRDRQPSKHMIDLAHEMVDNGMDIFVGYGGHVMQGIEIYKGRPIFYSMGDLSVHRTARSTSESGLAFLATSTYQDGILQEIRIHPVDLGLDRPASKLGVPMEPSAAVAAKILADLQHHSRPLGTEILIQGSIGVIRVAKEATAPIGQGIRDFGPPASSVLQGGGGRGGRGGGPPPF